jgi:pimeloyl-ACP methyl ester carboxylesterase
MRRFLRILRFFFFIILVLLVGGIILYLVGPRPDPDNLTFNIPPPIFSAAEAEGQLLMQEKSREDILRPATEAEIIWVDDSLKSVTPFSILYLHGFGASKYEGDPVHRYLAETFGANLLLARLAGHGLKTEYAMKGLRSKDLMNSTLQSLRWAEALGDSVIVVGTSTGASLGMWATTFSPTTAAVVLYSPIIRPYVDRTAKLLIGPWGKDLLKLLSGGEVIVQDRGDSIRNIIWSTYYHPDGYEALMQFVYAEMQPERLREFDLPLFLGYYYKNVDAQDKTVSVAAMLEMLDWIAVSPEKRRVVAFPEAGDHVIAGSVRSKDWQAVFLETASFLQSRGLQVVDSTRIIELTYERQP